MKRFLYTMAAYFILPIMFIGGVVYGVSYALQLLLRAINLLIDKGMKWVDKNITANL